MKKVLIALLIIIVLVLGGAYAYLALSSGEYDDIDALLAEPPMTSAERYLVNPSSKTVSIKINREDILRLVSKEMDGDIMGKLNESISEYGLSAEAIGIRTNDSKAEIDLKLKYKNFLPIPLRINADIAEDNGVLSVSLDTVAIGKLLTFDSVVLTDKVGEISIPEYDLKETSPLLKDIKSVDFGENEMEITIPYPMDWLMHGIETATSAFSMIVDFVDLEELDTPVPAMLAAVEGDDSGLVELLERDPRGMATLKTQLLGLNGSYTRSKFFSEDLEDSYSWLLPEITEESATTEGKAIIARYQALYDERTGKLADAWQYLVDGYADGSIKESKGTFIYTSDNSEVLLSELDALKSIDGWLNFDEMRIVFGENPGDFALHQVPTGNVVPAIILRTHVDRPCICYQFISTMFKVRSITEKEYEALMEAARVPVYDIGEHTTAR